MKPNKRDPKNSHFYATVAIAVALTVLAIVVLVLNFVPISERTHTITFLNGITRIEYNNGDVIEYPNTLSEIERANSVIITDTELININSASAEELQKLKGIGETKALAIIEYRTENGAFTTIEEIQRVNGIGEATFENIRYQITV